MRAFKAKPISFHDVAQMLEKEACVICSLLKRFQFSCIHDVVVENTRALCSFHAWAIAGGADAEVAARVFLQLLQTKLTEEGRSAGGCDICQKIKKEEDIRLGDFSTLLKDLQFRNWLDDYGALCLPHAARLLRRVGEADRDVILALVEQTGQRLKDALAAIATGDQAGSRRATSVLSRAAEHLEARRGLGRLEVAELEKRE
jgi:hypothetical protein